MTDENELSKRIKVWSDNFWDSTHKIMNKKFAYELTPAQIKVLHAGLIHLLDSEDHTDSETPIINDLIGLFEVDKDCNPLLFK